MAWIFSQELVVRFGMIVDGVCYRLTTWARRTIAKDGLCWPTLKASDGRRGWRSTNKRGNPSLPLSVGGKLNPTWCEWLMGYPDGWTELDASVIPWFRTKPAKHSNALWDSREEKS